MERSRCGGRSWPFRRENPFAGSSDRCRV
jgi:hypothetical protein